MATHAAQCLCGQLSIQCEGEPVRVSVCHCLDCQRRSGSAFAAQARWPSERLSITGETRTWTRIADSGGKVHYSFCPRCGSTVFYTNENWQGLTAIPVGAFADPTFPAPQFSVYEHRKHPWVSIEGADVDRSSTPSAVRAPLPTNARE